MRHCRAPPTINHLLAYHTLMPNRAVAIQYDMFLDYARIHIILYKCTVERSRARFCNNGYMFRFLPRLRLQHVIANHNETTHDIPNRGPSWRHIFYSKTRPGSFRQASMQHPKRLQTQRNNAQLNWVTSHTRICYRWQPIGPVSHSGDEMRHLGGVAHGLP